MTRSLLSQSQVQPHRRRLASAIAALGGAFAASLLAACGSDGPPSPERRVRILDEATELTPAPQLIERLGGFELTEENEGVCPWGSDSSHGSLFSAMETFGRFGPKGASRPVFVVRGEGGFTVKHPVPFEWGDGDVVTALVTLWGSGKERVRAVVLDGDGNPAHFGPWLGVERRKRAQVLTLAVPSKSACGVVDGGQVLTAGIGIEFEGPGKHAALLGLDLYRADLATGLPRVGEPQFVSIGGQGRDAAGLIEGAPWIWSSNVTERSRLRLSIAWPSIARRSGNPPTLTLRANGAGGEVLSKTIRWSESAGNGKADAWIDHEVAIGDLGDGEARFELAIEGSGSAGDEAFLVGDAVIVNPVPGAPSTVLLVTSDTHRADYFGASPESGRALTPVIDALGERGLAFEAAYSAANITNPSHIAMMTGIHPRDTHIVDNSTQLSPAAETLAESFRRAGYRTLAAISTQHLGADQSGLGQGFDRFDAPLGPKRHGVDAISIAREWLSESEGEPVFLWVHLFDAHTPYASKDVDTSEFYRGDPLALPEGRTRWPNEAPRWVLADGIQDPDYVEALYRGQVEYLDDALHGLLAEPRIRKGWTAFTADHGESFGANGIYWDHIGLYHSTVAVPLILVGPGVPVGTSRRPVGNINVARTLLDLSGVPSGLPGRNLASLKLTPDSGEPQFAIAAHGLQAAIFHGPWGLTLDLRSYSLAKFDHQWAHGRVRLFDRRDGLDTAEDHVDRQPELARQLRAKLLAWLDQAEGGELGRAAVLGEGSAANLEALGYGGFTAKPEGAWWTEDSADREWLERFKD